MGCPQEHVTSSEKAEGRMLRRQSFLLGTWGDITPTTLPVSHEGGLSHMAPNSSKRVRVKCKPGPVARAPQLCYQG